MKWVAIGASLAKSRGPSRQDVIALQKHAAAASAKARDAYATWERNNVSLIRYGTAVGSTRDAILNNTTEEQRKATLARANARFDQIANERTAVFSKPVDAKTLFDTTDQSWQLATKQMETFDDAIPKPWIMSDPYKAERHQIESITLHLLELRAQAKLLRDDPDKVEKFIKAPVMPGSKQSEEYRNAIKAIYYWNKNILNKAIARQEFYLSILDIPSGAIAYIAHQARMAIKATADEAKHLPDDLGIPTWVLPVAAVAVGGVLLLTLANKANAITEGRLPV